MEDVKIKLELEPDIWTIKADESNIEQVITNLCINARDAMPKGGTITIKTENVNLSKEKSEIRMNDVQQRIAAAVVTSIQLE